ncbi:MAG: hydrogenase expression/formation protein HypE [Candidatus Kapabacteria bacterium]|jgi:hydrogenase expression/formation protein HypE|nr:hydrogenase expression/formation protein HypE [Candidatus Kapabacteria bacterium]
MTTPQKLSMQLQCPMPQLDFDIITLGHGSGGLLTHKLLDSGVFDVLKNPLLDARHDGAVFPVEAAQRLAFTTDSFVIAPIFFPGGNIGEIAVFGTVNDLAMCGAIPRYISLAFIIEEGLPMTEFWEVLLGVKSAAERAGVHVVTGDTKVVERGKGDKIFINTSGIGIVHEQASISLSRVAVGDSIILSSSIANHGIAVMAEREGLQFESTITSDTRPLNHAVKRLLDEFGASIHLLRDPTRGGVATTLNEIARDTKLGINIRQKPIAIDEQVYGVCEILGLDPLYVANEGVFVAIVAADAAEAVVERLRGELGSEIGGHEAAVIGEVVSEHPRQVVLQSRIGGRRVVSMLVGEQLPRIC